MIIIPESAPEHVFKNARRIKPDTAGKQHSIRLLVRKMAAKESPEDTDDSVTVDNDVTMIE